MSITPIKPVEMMKGDFQDFIGVWEDHVPKFVCDKAIKLIDETQEKTSYSYNGLGQNSDPNEFIMRGNEQFPETNLGRDDFSILLRPANSDLYMEFEQYLHACFLDYVNHYGQLKACPLISTDQKIQKTPPKGGYHVWHFEASNYFFCTRILVWAIYLNDIPEGEGETEFLYQGRRIAPKRGTCVIWPAGCTHVHRGNPVYTKNKYILTGWYNTIPT